MQGLQNYARLRTYGRQQITNLPVGGPLFLYESLSGRRSVKPCQSLANPTTPRVSVSVKLEDLEDLQLEVDVARRLRLAAIAHTYHILPYCSS